MNNMTYAYYFSVCFAILSFSFALYLLPVFLFVKSQIFYISYQIVYYAVIIRISHKLSLDLMRPIKIK